MKRSLLSILVLVIMSVTTLAVPNQLTYSGRLLQNGALVNSTLTMTFKIWTDASAGSLLWSTSNINVDVNQGIYSVVLDQVSPNVFVTDNAYLEVIIGAETLAPRTRINSVGYALQAGGLSAGGVRAVTVSTNGNVGIGTTAPGAVLEVSGNSNYIFKVNGAYSVFNNNTLRHTYGVSNHLWDESWADTTSFSYHNGTSWSTNRISFDNLGNFNTAGALTVSGIGNSSIAGSLGIGTTASPATLNVVRAYPGSTGTFEVARFDVLDSSGTAPRGIKILGSAGSGAVGFAKDTNADFQIWDDSTNPLMTIKNNGYVGIGTTNPSGGLTISTGGDSRFDVKSSTAGNAVVRIISNHANYGSIDSMDGLYVNPKNLVFQINGGNVGIGNSSPWSALVVNGPATNPSGTHHSSGIASFYGGGNGIELQIGEQIGAPYGMWLQSKHELADNSYHPIELNPLGGNVGIGTTSPSEALDVSGNILANGALKFSGTSKTFATIFNNFYFVVPVSTTYTLTVVPGNSFGFTQVDATGYSGQGSGSFITSWVDGGHGGGTQYHNTQLYTSMVQGASVLGPLTKTVSGSSMTIQNTSSSFVLQVCVQTRTFGIPGYDVTVTCQ
ncbi:MAG: hypothetical protein WC838_04780 [Candidatus Margulisiibacteriota bacterium]|jgi:hypothetical protein